MRSQEAEDPEVEKVGQEEDGQEHEDRGDRIVTAVMLVLVGALGLLWDEDVIPNPHDWRERDGERNHPDDNGGDQVGDS